MNNLRFSREKQKDWVYENKDRSVRADEQIVREIIEGMNELVVDHYIDLNVDGMDSFGKESNIVSIQVNFFSDNESTDPPKIIFSLALDKRANSKNRGREKVYEFYLRFFDSPWEYVIHDRWYTKLFRDPQSFRSKSIGEEIIFSDSDILTISGSKFGNKYSIQSCELSRSSYLELKALINELRYFTFIPIGLVTQSMKEKEAEIELRIGGKQVFSTGMNVPATWGAGNKSADAPLIANTKLINGEMLSGIIESEFKEKLYQQLQKIISDRDESLCTP